MIWLIVGCIIIIFGAVAFRGAPYVPTLQRSVGNALELMDLQKGDLIVDLGAGDGKVLQAAANRGLRALGYEINPLLYLIAKARALPRRRKIAVHWRDFWLAEWPHEAKGVFIFLAGPYMSRLSRRLAQEMERRQEPLRVVSYGFAIPGFLPKKIQDGMYLYELKPTAPNPREVKWNPRLPKLWKRDQK